MARCPSSVPATTIPPRNAPSASESPASEVSHAVPMHSPREEPGDRREAHA